MSDFITPTVGRVVWFYPASNTAESGFHRRPNGGPYAALIAHVWHDRMVNLSVLDANGNPHSRTSVPMVQGDDPAPDSAFCGWMPFQKGQARAQESMYAAVQAAEVKVCTDGAKVTPLATNQRVNDALKAAATGAALPPAADAHIRNVLYGAIRDAMEELGSLHPGFNDHVNRAWNHLHRAYWSEVPAPASAPGLRDELPAAEPGIDLSPTKQQPTEQQAAAHDLMVRTLAVSCGLPVDDGMLTFGAAIEQVKAGARVARAGWNGKGQFVYLVPPASYAAQTGVAKAHFGERAMVPYNAYLALKTVDGTVSTWAPSVSDCLAEDWVVAPA